MLVVLTPLLCDASIFEGNMMVYLSIIQIFYHLFTFRLLPVFLSWSLVHVFPVVLHLLQWTVLKVLSGASSISTSQF